MRFRLWQACFYILMLCTQPLTALSPDLLKDFGWPATLPSLQGLGQLGNPQLDNRIALIHAALGEPYSLEWIEHYVKRELRRPFSLSYGSFLAQELPFTEILSGLPASNDQYWSCSVQARGAEGKLHRFSVIMVLDQSGAYKLVALSGIPIEGPSETIVADP